MSEYVIFSIGEQLMAIPIENVERIMSTGNINKIPLFFDCIEGALNYHDQIISVINLRKLLRLEGDYKSKDVFQVVIVQTVQSKAAILIDEVKDIEIVEKDAPSLSVNNRYFSSVVQSKNHMINVLKPEIIDFCNVG